MDVSALCQPDRGKGKYKQKGAARATARARTRMTRAVRQLAKTRRAAPRRTTSRTCRRCGRMGHRERDFYYLKEYDKKESRAAAGLGAMASLEEHGHNQQYSKYDEDDGCSHRRVCRGIVGSPVARGCRDLRADRGQRGLGARLPAAVGAEHAVREVRSTTGTVMDT